MNFVLVGPDEFGKNRSRWCWVGNDQVNDQMFWLTKRRSAVGARHIWMCRYNQVPQRTTSYCEINCG